MLPTFSNHLTLCYTDRESPLVQVRYRWNGAVRSFIGRCISLHSYPCYQYACFATVAGRRKRAFGNKVSGLDSTQLITIETI